VMFDANDPTGKTIYAGTSDGVLQTTDNGATWRNFNLDSLPLVQVFDLQQNPQTLLAGTHGRSVWKIDTAGALTADVAVTKVDESQPLGSSVQLGAVTISNPNKVSLNLVAATLGVTNPSLFASVSAEAAGQTVTRTSVGTATTFYFPPGLQVPAEISLEIKFTGILETSSPAVASVTSRGGANRFVSGARIRRAAASRDGLVGMVGVVLLVLVMVAMPGRVPRRLTPMLAMAMLAAVLAITEISCGGDNSGRSSNPGEVLPATTPGTSNQGITQVWLSGQGDSARVTGLPGDLGTTTALP